MLSFFPRGVLDEILNLIESVSEGFPSYSCKKLSEAHTFLLDNIYIRFGSKLYRQIVGIPTGANCAPLVADLFFFCYKRDFLFFFQMILNLTLLKP